MEDWKDKLGALYAAVPKADDDALEPEGQADVPASDKKQTLRVELDKRNGKPATLITGFEGPDEELKELAKTLKVKCGAGGSARGGEMLIQGDVRVKVSELLLAMGYKVKKINFK